MKCVIVGTGAVGLSLMDELHRKEHEVVLVNRSGSVPEPLPHGVVLESADASDEESLKRVTQGAALIIHCFGLPYAEWQSKLAPAMDGVISAARHHGARVLYFDNLYAYGDNEGKPISEATPERATGKKGILRMELAQKLMDEDRAGRFAVTIARSSDYFGPRGIASALGPRVFDHFIAGRPAEVFGRLDMPHTFSFLKDIARSLTVLAENEDAHGRVWHLPSPQPITQQQIMDILRAVTNKPVAVKAIGAKRVSFAGVFDPEAKEMTEMMYRWEKPFVVNHSRFATTFGERTTPLEQAVFDTLEWYKRRAGITRRLGH